ncbi:hypothetical protein [uncultured Tenacibaculum sp.]|uniref:hypothetical protein n=1 Tax=uncultured Tenacibaculum sp. TaxID=174713 RepID=UPI00260DA16E|nr:hypothetical protein [uncultured Tenacibaculum sp.]
MTKQAQDILHYNQTEYFLNQEILKDYFRKYPKKRPENDFVSSAMWRGYIAEFQIRENQLYVLNKDYNLADLFPDNGKLEWYSGLIRIDDFGGEFSEEPKNGIFEYLEILNGNLIRHRKFDYEELQTFKKEQFKYFLISDEIELVYEFWRKNNENGIINKDGVNKIIAERIMEYTKEVYAE